MKGAWPVAFMVWRYRGAEANLNPTRSIQLIDLTWLKKQQLAEISWGDAAQTKIACEALIANPLSKVIELGVSRPPIREWSGKSMLDFKRSRRKIELDQELVGGLPLGDTRRNNKKAYGEITGTHIGFMDDLTPCRVARSTPGRPWFRLNSQFMDIKKNRCFSGPPTHWGYCADDLGTAQKLFFWYALARTFLQRRYPMWVDADDLWSPTIPSRLEYELFSTAFAIGFAENECVEAYFPANNPAPGCRELYVQNPMTPLDSNSFWSTVLRPYIRQDTSPETLALIAAVEAVYDGWSDHLRNHHEVTPTYPKPYFVSRRILTRAAGLVQVRDYATAQDLQPLIAAIADVQVKLKIVKDRFFELVTASEALNYFGPPTRVISLAVPEKTRFEKVLCRRLAVSGLLVNKLHNDPNFGRTKLAKLFYLSDLQGDLQLDTEYLREAAGPLDPRSLYHERVGVEALALRYGLFQTEPSDIMVRYRPLDNLKEIDEFASKYLGDQAERINELATLFQPFTTDQSEIVATLFACWNDFLVQKHSPTDEEIISECVQHWHPKKARFSRGRLARALSWMREHDIVPAGRGRITKVRDYA